MQPARGRYRIWERMGKETSTGEPDRLESWKQIAAYLNKSERTTRRWHELEGLPVHKHRHQQRGSVWAYRNELDQWLAGRTERPEQDPEPLPGGTARWKWALLAGLAGAAIAGVLTFHVAGPRAGIERAVRSAPLTSLPGSEYGASFSPDGKKVVFHWSKLGGGGNGLHVKEIDKDVAPAPLVVSTAQQRGFMYSPAWSPDGTTIAYLERTAVLDTWLCTTAPDGGSRRRLRQISASPVLLFGNHQHISWSRDSQFVFIPMSLGNEKGIYRVSMKTGDAVAIANAEAPFGPAISPDGSGLVWLRRQGLPIAHEEILLTRLNSEGVAAGDPVPLYKGQSISSGIAWAADSRSLFFCNAEGSLMGAVANRLFALPAVAGAAPVAIGAEGCNTVSVTRAGDVVIGNASKTKAKMMQVSLQEPGAAREFVTSSRHDSHPAFSADGEKIAFYSNRSGQPEIWVVQRDGSGLRRITENSKVDSGPVWSPANDEILYGSGRSLVIVALHGAKVARIEVQGAVVQNPVWSRDGQTLYYTAGSRLWRTRRDGSGRAMLRELPETLQLAESPDGNYLYYSRPFVVARIPVNGGAEEKVEDGLLFPFFAVTRNAVYVVRRDHFLYALPLTGGMARRVPTVPAFDIAGHRVWEAHMAASPDDSTMVWVRLDDQDVDLELWKVPRR